MSDTPNTAAATPLSSFVKELEDLARTKAHADAGIARVYGEAHRAGYDKKVLKLLLAERAGDVTARSEQDQLLASYRAALLETQAAEEAA